jgi:hypothetical protein
MVEVMRKNQFKTDNNDDFEAFRSLDFNQQQDLVKNQISKAYQIVVVTSFNERTVYGVIGKNDVDQYFYAIDKNVQKQLTLDQLKTLI